MFKLISYKEPGKDLVVLNYAKLTPEQQANPPFPRYRLAGGTRIRRDIRATQYKGTDPRIAANLSQYPGGLHSTSDPSTGQTL